MKIHGIIWLEDIVEKLEWKHHVQQHEVIEVLQLSPAFRLVEKGHRPGNISTRLQAGLKQAGISLSFLCINTTSRH